MILCACVEERETESEEGEGKKKILDFPPYETDTGDTVNDFKVQSENIIQYAHEMQRTICMRSLSL